MTEPVVAYFSMEIGLDSDLPTYCGGLGALAAALDAGTARQSVLAVTGKLPADPIGSRLTWLSSRYSWLDAMALMKPVRESTATTAASGSPTSPRLLWMALSAAR